MPAAQALLYGVKPVMIAVVVQALWALARTAVKTPALAVGGATIVALALAGVNEIALLFLGGFALADVLGGWPAAVLATVAIFLPAFVFVALSGPIIPRLRRWRWTAALLDGMNVAALGLMAAVTWQLARAALVEEPLRRFGAPGVGVACVLAVTAAVLLLRFRVNSVWLVAGGAVVGVVAGFLWGIP